MDYTVTECRHDDHDALAALHAQLIGGSRRLSRRYLRWKYEANPFIPSPLLFVVRQGDQIVGMRGLYGTQWQLGQTPGIVLPHADDLIIDPDHRNRGLFLLLHQATVAAAEERGYPAILSLSGGATTQQLSLMCGYRELGELNKLSRPLVAPSTGRRVRGRVARELRRRVLSSSAIGWESTMHDVWRQIRAHAARSSTNLVTSTRADGAAMASLVDASVPEPCRSDRTEAFFRWRLGNPDRTYRCIYWRDSELRGYLVLAWDPMQPHHILIADHAAENDVILAELLAALGQRSDIEFRVMSSSVGATRRRLFEAVGFVPDPDRSEENRRRFLYYPVTPEGDLGRFVPADGDPGGPMAAGWRLTLLDTMAA